MPKAVSECVTSCSWYLLNFLNYDIVQMFRLVFSLVARPSKAQYPRIKGQEGGGGKFQNQTPCCEADLRLLPEYVVQLVIT